MMVKFGQFLLVVASLTYASFVWEIALGFPLDPHWAYLSEYAAADSPHRTLFAATDLITAVLVLVALLCLWRLWPRWEASSRIIAVALVVMGAATIGDVFFPMPCAESLPTCPVDHFGSFHIVTSTVVVTAQVLLAAVMLRSRSWLAKAGGAGFLLSTVMLLVCTAVHIPAGFIQRAQVLFACVVIFAASTILPKYVDHSARLGMPA